MKKQLKLPRITRSQLKQFLAEHGVHPVLRPDEHGNLVEGYESSQLEPLIKKYLKSF